MTNAYIYQPIQVHPSRELQDFRRPACTARPKNTYLKQSQSGGHGIYLPCISILREPSGQAFSVGLFTLNDTAVTGLTDPGFASVFADDPVNAYEIANFDKGYWGTTVAPADGDYYLKFSDDDGNLFWSDSITLIKCPDSNFLQLNVYPPPCAEAPWAKLSWGGPECIYSGKSTDKITNILAFAPGSSFFVYIEGGALVDAEWADLLTGYKPLGSGSKQITTQFINKRWKLKGRAVSAATIDAMQASAFFSNIRLYFEGMDDALFQCYDVIVDSSTPDGGCSYDFEYTFRAGYLSKQGCCAE